MASNIVELIKQDEALARIMSEDDRCSHFTKGPCHACKMEETAAKYKAKLASLSEACDEEYEANGCSKAWETMLDEYNQLHCDLMELSHP